MSHSSQRPRRRSTVWLAALLALLGGAALATTVLVRRLPPVLPAPDDAVIALAQRLHTHVQALAGDIGPRHVGRAEALDAARAYIEARLFELDYVAELQHYDARGTSVANVEARIGGQRSRYFVLGAHYDTVPGTPGANDNASGVAVLLEVARLLRTDDAAAGVRFVAFVNEEPPWFQSPLMGSVVYASRARARGDEVAGMLSLETMGFYSDAEGTQRYPAPFDLFFPGTGHFLAGVSDFGSVALLRRVSRGFRRASPLPLISSPAPAAVPGVGWSDHWAFWQQGYQAMMFTDTAPYRYPHYHAASDTPDKLDYVRLAYAVEGVRHAVAAEAMRILR